MADTRLSVIIPAFNEEENIEVIEQVIVDALDRESIKFELVFIDDGSIDRTFENIRTIHQQRTNVRGIKFSRNFGKEAAILAGLKDAKGDCIAVLDCDMQHPPEILVKMYRLWEAGYDIVEGVKSSRGKERILNKCGAGLFYGFISRAVGFDMSSSSDFKLISKEVADIIASLPESNLFFRALTYWVGFRTTSVFFDVAERTKGDTKWSPIKLFKYALRNMVSFTTAPLQIVTALGMMMILISLGVSIDALISYFTGVAAAGYTTVIILLLLIGGSIMISLGIIGLYIGEIFREVKNRPSYLIQERTE